MVTVYFGEIKGEDRGWEVKRELRVYTTQGDLLRLVYFESNIWGKSTKTKINQRVGKVDSNMRELISR